MKRCTLVLCMFLMLGCSSVPSGDKQGIAWYNPTTWFSGSAGRKAERLDEKDVEARGSALKSVQRAVNETSEALQRAPESRPVSVAKGSNDQARIFLDQLAGPMTVEESKGVAEQVRLLLSDLEQERAEGERLREINDSLASNVSETLSVIAKAKIKNEKDLEKAFERENALANQLRNERWWSWFWKISIGAVAILLFAAWIYVRFTLGWMPTALGRSLSDARKSNPEFARFMEEQLDTHLTPTEQKMIRMLTIKG